MRSDKMKNMVLAALLAAVTAVLAQIIIPLGTVPFTMAVFGVFLMGMLLTPRYALASILVYILMGMVGVPVFAGFSAGPAVLAGPTGGYVVGYIFLALVPALARAQKLPGWAVFAAALVGLTACYALGTAWFMVQTGNGLVASLGWCVLPFILPDVAKAAGAMALARALEKRLATAGTQS